jgi:thiamine-phosphate pyrophosphorylase
MIAVQNNYASFLLQSFARKNNTMKYISSLHYIASTPQYANEACMAGINWVQLRVKDTPKDEWLRYAIETREICAHHKAVFLVNDSVEIAANVGADGVHLGKADMRPSEARKILGPSFIIGGTANTFEDIVRLTDEGVDYIGLGPFRFTTTKKNLSPILGLNGYEAILSKMKDQNIHIPIIAIGGITPVDVKAIKKTGVHGIAISSAITLADNKKEFINTVLADLC